MKVERRKTDLRCPKHHCPMVQVAGSSSPICLLDWLIQRAGGKKVLDLVPRGKDLPAVALTGGFLLPFKRAIQVANGQDIDPTLEDVAEQYVADILYVLPPQGDGAEALVVELLPKGAKVDEDPGLLLQLDVDALRTLLETPWGRRKGSRGLA